MTRNREKGRGKLWGGVDVRASDIRPGQVVMLYGRAARIIDVDTHWDESVRDEVTALHYTDLAGDIRSRTEVYSYATFVVLFAPIFAESPDVLYREKA